ncbi:MAG TPA: glycoside hydrolase family 127 protein [Armatimonadota bacterium]|nr:glycoside hydrolase family 127 protein [Armatimonadota bacterium]
MTPYTFKPLAPGDVKLLWSTFSQRFEANKNYLASLRTDNLIRAHYMEAGLWAAPEYVKDIHWGWESPSCQLRGHFVGHWLWAAAHIYASTGDEEFKARGNKIVSEIARCQKENGDNWAGSIPPKYLDWAARGKYVWAPHYTIHKNMFGLLEMYKFAGNQQALDILVDWSEWFYKWTGQFTQEQMDNLLDVETGGMLEIWADLYGETRDPKHLELLHRYDRRRLFDRLLAGEDVLTNMHANTTIPEVMGAARAWEVTGEDRYRKITEAYWKFAVTDRGYYCTGGQTCGEIWGPNGELSARLGEKTQEHCTVYHMIRLADYLQRWTGDVACADYIERNTYNGILAQQHPETGMVTYFLPLHGGAQKKWGTPTEDFWCCHGTLVQAHVLHNAYVYYEDAEGLVVAQFIPTEAAWKWNGVPVKVLQTIDMQKEQTRRPKNNAFNLTVQAEQPVDFTLKIRLPWWLKGEATITVNGEKQKIESKQSSYVSIKRTWKDDKVHVVLPKGLVAEPLPDLPDTVAFVDGPVVLAGLCDEERTLIGDKSDPETILTPDCERLWGAWQPGYRTINQDRGIRFVPLYSVRDEKYSVYFPVRRKG